MNCYFTMPFRKRARIVVRNDHAHAIPALFYQIDYALGNAYSSREMLISMRNGADSQSLTLGEDYVILDGVSGRAITSAHILLFLRCNDIGGVRERLSFS